MNNTRIDIVQKLLLNWMACDDRKRSYESVRKSCEYLDQAYELGLEGNAIWVLFQPLFRTGVIDFVGKDCYALCPTIAIERNGVYIYNSVLPPSNDHNQTPFVGIYRTNNYCDIQGLRVINFSAAKVLKNFPSVKEIVDSFDKSIEDLSSAEYYHYKGTKGLTKRFEDGTVRYFCIPELVYQREVPGREVNPDAFSIAYSYSRCINGEHTGLYNSKSRSLQMLAFGLPASVERILFLESMLEGYYPQTQNVYKIFPGIREDIVKQLDRIFLNTIKHE